MPAVRLLPSDEAQDLLDLTREICARDLAPRVDVMERAAEFPSETFRLLGRTGLLSLPYPEEYGGGGQPYEVYLQVVEEIATVWMSVAVGVSVHALTCYPVAAWGTDAQRAALLPGMLGGEQLGAYCLSEPMSGSDVGSMTTRATRVADDADGYVIKGVKAWISHAGHADYYTSFVRTSDDGSRGLSCFVVPADAAGIELAPPERKMGLSSDTVRQVTFAGTPVSRRPAGRRGGPRDGGRARGPRLGSARDRCCRNRSGAGRARPRHGIREGARAVRAADR